MIESSCHCGAVKLQIDAELPETLTSCNCSICKRYGCFSHWRGTQPVLDRMGLNARLFTNVDINPVRIRHFDGADTWKFLD